MSAAQIPPEKLKELQALQVEYEQLKNLQTTLALQLESLKSEITETDLAIKELQQLKEEEKDALVPMGPVLVKAKLQKKVLYPLGADVFVALSSEEAAKKLEERKKNLEEQLKVLEAELAKVNQALASIEAKVAEVYRGLSGAGKAQGGTKESGK